MMRRQTFNGFRHPYALLAGLCLSLCLVLVPVLPAVADDIAVYTQLPSGAAQPNDTMPLVVVIVGRNLDSHGVDELYDVACSNIFSIAPWSWDLITGNQCEAIWQSLILPILDRKTEWSVSFINDLRTLDVGLWDIIPAAIKRGRMAEIIAGILRDGGLLDSVASSDLVFPVSRTEVVKLMLYRILHQLVGARVVVMANNDSTCPDFDPKHPADSKHCSNGAFIVLGATKLKRHQDATNAYYEVFDRLGEWDASNLDAATVTRAKLPLSHPKQVPDDDQGHSTPPYQGKEAYYELLQYLTGGAVYSAKLNADNLLDADTLSAIKKSLGLGKGWALGDFLLTNDWLGSMNLVREKLDPSVYDGDGDYTSPLDPRACKPIKVINIMFSPSAEDDESDSLIKSELGDVDSNGDGLKWAEMRKWLATKGFTYSGDRYYIESRFIVVNVDGQLTLPADMVGLDKLSFGTKHTPLTTITALDPSRAVEVGTSFSMAGPQRVFSPSSVQAANDIYVGLFHPDTDHGTATWPGNLKKLKLARHQGVLKILGALGKPAIGPDGTIKDSARTCWTDAEKLPPIANGKDGGMVTQGGAGMSLGPPAFTNAEGADIFYQTSDSAPDIPDEGSGVAKLNLDGNTLDELLCENAAGTCNSAFGDNTNYLEAAQRVAWARGYKVGSFGSKDNLQFYDYLFQKGVLETSLTTEVLAGTDDGQNWRVKIKRNSQVLYTLPITSSFQWEVGTDYNDYLYTKQLSGLCIKDVLELEYYDCYTRKLDNSLNPSFCHFVVEGTTDFLGIPIVGTSNISGIQCNVSEVTSKPSALEARDWLMGDVLHSTPLAIDYGTQNGGSDVRIFVGTNQGFLHQFKGSTGEEVWRFAPRAVMDNFDEWAKDADLASRPYGIDGAPVAWVKDTDHDGVIEPKNDEHVYLYFGLRRGGKAYYALDVTKPDTKPKLLWYIDSDTPGFSELGRTFSVPRIGQILVPDDAPDLESDDADEAHEEITVLVFGGGYDPDYDHGNIPSGDIVGNAIYVVNAKTGMLIWKATRGKTQASFQVSLPEYEAVVYTHPAFDDPIPSTITALDTDGDGYLDRLYVGDIGGRVWRVNMGTMGPRSLTDPSEWEAAPIANLGRHWNRAEEDPKSEKGVYDDDRRFFHRPDVVRVGQGEGAFYALVVGSGDRADPLDTNTDNYLYVIMDSGGLDNKPITPDDLAGFARNCSASDRKDYDKDSNDKDACTSLLDPDFEKSGWMLALGGFVRRGEKIMSTPTTLGGTVLVSSYVPAVNSNSCSPFGKGRLYAINLLTAQPVLDEFRYDGELNGYHNGINPARGTMLDSSGIPGGVTYVGGDRFLTSDLQIIDVPARTIWRTYWRRR